MQSTIEFFHYFPFTLKGFGSTRSTKDFIKLIDGNPNCATVNCSNTTSCLGAQAPQSLEKAKQIAESLKTAFQSADPKLVWFEDPTAALTARRLLSLRGRRPGRIVN
jgi:hypothetical protein